VDETDPERRRKLVDEMWVDRASYTDPLAEAHGRDAIGGAGCGTVPGILEKVPV
jgi:hypothetical protein